MDTRVPVGAEGRKRVCDTRERGFVRGDVEVGYCFGDKLYGQDSNVSGEGKILRRRQGAVSAGIRTFEGSSSRSIVTMDNQIGDD